MPRRLALVALALLPALACNGDPKHVFEKKPIAEVRHQGFRQDIPDERRGNATFYKTVFTREGNYLVTFGPDFRLWDSRTGALLPGRPRARPGRHPGQSRSGG